MIHQNSMRFYDDIVYDKHYNGLVLDEDEGGLMLHCQGFDMTSALQTPCLKRALSTSLLDGFHGMTSDTAVTGLFPRHAYGARLAQLWLDAST